MALTRAASRCSRTSWGTEVGEKNHRLGQMSVEAALLLPVVLTLLALLVQPVCVLYTRTVMASTAGERPADWELEVTGPDEGGSVLVALEGRVRPLPLLGALVAALGTGGDGTVLVRVETRGDLRADWIGGDYDDWVGMWG